MNKIIITICVLLISFLQVILADIKSSDSDGSIDDLIQIHIRNRDYPKALAKIKEGIDNNKPNSYAALGFMYFNGLGVEKDKKKAVDLYKKSASLKSHIGQNNLGQVYQYGLAGEKIDLKKAIENYSLSANQNNVSAMHSIAMIYLQNKQYSNVKLGISWMEKASRLDHLPAISDLAFLYQKGIGVNKDMKKALDLYIKAINRGSPNAAFNLAVLYKQGGGIKQDIKKAKELFLLASEKNHGEAMFELSMMYYKGEGVKKDQQEFAKWLKKSAMAGSRRAISLINQLKQK